jgi:hypothetical protein
MNIMKKFSSNLFGLMMLLFISFQTRAQLTVSGEVRTRTEYRDGVGTLKLKGNGYSFFTSQRTRLSLDYRISHIVFHTTIQDTRVWGQDIATISNTDGNRLGLHEGWAEIQLANKSDTSFRHSAVDYFAVKIGRQEIIYDDSRLLGNLDWLQQARRHDAIVFKLKHEGWQADLGVAFNQNTDAYNYNGTYYPAANVQPYVKDSKGNLTATPAAFIPLINSNGFSAKNGTPAVVSIASSNGAYENYKALEYLYVAKTFNKTKVSVIGLADQFGKYGNDSIRNIAGTDTGYIYGKRFNRKGVYSRFTTGVYINSFLDNQKAFELTASAYYQTGKDRDGQKLSAYSGSVALTYAKYNFSYAAGWDYLSGDDAFSASTKSHRFDPLYGTPHKFWGLMDYFYVVTGSPTGGLSNPFAKIRYCGARKRFTAEVAYHYFNLAKNQRSSSGQAIKKYLGSEVDLVTTYELNKITTLEYGFGVMAASRSMEYAKGITPNTANLTGYWSYLMITIKPEFIFK